MKMSEMNLFDPADEDTHNAEPAKWRALPRISMSVNNREFKVKVGEQRFRKYLRVAALNVCPDESATEATDGREVRRGMIHELFLLLRYTPYQPDQIGKFKEDLRVAKNDGRFWHKWTAELIERVLKDSHISKNRTTLPQAYSLSNSVKPARLLLLVERFETRACFAWLHEKNEKSAKRQDPITHGLLTSMKKLEKRQRPVKARQVIMTPAPWRASDPPFRIARAKGFFGHETLHPTVLTHSLVLGGTGCGKSQSVVIPIMNAMLGYKLRDGTEMSMLVIDPKRELAAVIDQRIQRDHPSRRVTVIGKCPPVRFFDEGLRLSPADKLDELRLLLDQNKVEENSYWRELADALLADLMRLEQDFQEKTQTSLLKQMLDDLRPGEVFEHGFWHQLRYLLDHTRTSSTRLRDTARNLARLLDLCKVSSPAASVFKNFTGDNELIQQWNYVCMSADTLLKSLTDPDFTRAVDADPYPRRHKAHMNIQRIIDRGRIVVFQPSNSKGATIAARALKARFYAAVFSRQQMHRPVGIIVDEAHRFVTQDRISGEQALLDRCRSYRTNVVLATQSLKSLEHAMGSGVDAKDAVRILVANTPSRWLMRSTEPDSSELLRQLLPPPPSSGMHIADARPPSQLAPGEAYWLLSDGRWGRSRAKLENMN
ncbi:hypothetical protein B9Z37_03795 [Limnohabitans parvus II-B4]|uniref:Uncharacterized protein n=2 Tax=Limnohabitans TaxID=665874 RepID=A0A315EGE7_9BURK|nr:hypothetical protein B9Z37_03795 [Limnohabitans parvus II-B4]